MKTKNALYLHVNTFHKHHRDSASMALNIVTTEMSPDMFKMD